MSTTRSPSRREQATRAKAPANTALVLAAHGERNVPDPNRALADHANALAARGDFCFVGYGVLNGEPSFDMALEEAAKTNPEKILIYPFFMSDGYFVSTVLPERIARVETDVVPTILTPLGLDAGLVPVMIGSALSAAADADLVPRKTRLLVVGHGSRSGRASANATLHIADALEAEGQFMSVSSTFLEEPPFVGNQLASEKSPVVVSGFFAGNGMHSAHDVPAAIEESGAKAVYAGPIGVDPAVRNLIVAACHDSMVNPR